MVRKEYKAGEFVGDHGLIFIEEVEPHVQQPSGKKVRKGRFLCSCNQEFCSLLGSVKRGMATSCGCVQKEKASCVGRGNAGESSGNWRGGVHTHYLYWTWNNMRARCFNERCKSYPNYGGRGITMHEPWINDSVAFTEWMDENLGPRPEGFSIDRIDNDGHYVPGNLRWADKSTQQKNQRRNLK